jgi:hypothetical protein
VIEKQLPLEPTEHIDPKTIVTLTPGIDAVCEGGLAHKCRYPFCCCYQKEDDDSC